MRSSALKVGRALLAALPFLAGALVAMGPTLLHADWPENHEGLGAFSRVEHFRRAFLEGDFFPLWSRFCFQGHGTPAPLLYHRLFNFVAGAFAVPLGTDAGLRVGLWLFGALGMAGLYRAARGLGADAWVAFAAAWAFVSAPYVMTDWLIRGSPAEATAVLLTPWLLEGLLRWVRGERAHLSLGLWLAALFHAHMVMFLFAAPLVALAFALRLRLPGRTVAVADAAIAGGVVLLVAGPVAFLVLKLGPFFRVDALNMFLPWDQLVAWPGYFADTAFQWGRQWQGVSVEVGRWLWASLALGAVAGLAKDLRRVKAAPVALLAGAIVFYGFLQLEVSMPLYRAVPRATLLQFPWRLVGFLTPAVALLAAALWGAAARGGLKRRLAGALVWAVVAVLHLASAWRAQAIHYQRYTPEVYAQHVTHLDDPWTAREMMPVTVGYEPPPRTPLVRVDGCTVVRQRPELGEETHFRVLEVELDAPQGCVVALSQFATPILTAEGDGVEGRLADGTLALQVRPGGTVARFRVRSVWELFRALL